MFDFVTLPDRKGHDALAVDMVGDGGEFAPDAPLEGYSLVPMWVADMNFICCPSVIDAIKKRLEYPTFGYFMPSKEYFDAIKRWQKKRNGAEVPSEAVGYENGVLGCLASALAAFTSPGEKVFLHSPTYIGFTKTLASTGREAVHSSLYRDGDGVWRIDYEDTEKKIKENGIRFAIFCSPHNPCGRVWEKEEILKFTEICKKYDVTIFSDEIWSDMVLSKEKKHIPTHSVSDDAKMRTITAYAPSKTFNLAGLVGSYRVVFNPDLRDKLAAVEIATHYNDMNVLSQHALIGAFSPEGEAWFEELRQVLHSNAVFAYNHIKELYKGVSLAMPEGTYMLYLDLTEYLKASGRDFYDVLKAGWNVGVAWQDGRPFLMDNTIRINLALPEKTVREAFDRLDRYVFKI